jgi:CelD/BcsL family acetyltransferase involved in cellulose biosynthesis
MINDNTIARDRKKPSPNSERVDSVSSQNLTAATIQVIRNLDELEQFAQSWDSLGSVIDSPMQHFIWSQACARIFKSAGKLNTIVVRRSGRPSAIAPLIKRRSAPRRLETIGVKELYEPMDFLYADHAALEELAGNLAGQGTALWLRRLPADSPVIEALQNAFKGRGWVDVLPVDPFPYIELGPEWIDPERRFNSGRRSDFRRAQRHASQMGEVSFEVISPNPSEVGSLLDEAYRVELASWKGAEGSALAVDPVRGAFFKQYAIAASVKGILRLVFMRVDGQAAGMQIAIECGDRFWLLKIGHDDKYSKCSPGTLLMLHSVQYAASRGLRSYEFLGTSEPWTRNWTESLRPCVALRAYPFGINGVAALAYDRARLVLSRIKRKVKSES